MTDEHRRRYRSPIVGDLRLPPPGAGPGAEGEPVDPGELVPMLVELNVRYPGGLLAVQAAFHALWERYADQAGGVWPEGDPAVAAGQPSMPQGLAFVAPKLYQCVLSRRLLRELVDADQQLADDSGRPPTIFRVWPDYTLEAQIDRSAPTVKADAAWRSYAALGNGIVWAVVDSGIDACHPHFSALELAAERRGDQALHGATDHLHRDFSFLVNPADPAQPLVPAAPALAAGTAAPGVPAVPASPSALMDESGHGTHVAGIIAGCSLEGAHPRVALSRESSDGGFVPRERHGTLSGMAPACELVSLKVMRRNRQGSWVTSSAAVIRALTYLRAEVNVDPAVLRVHGVNMSLGCEWKPDQYAAGQSPLCQAVNQLVASGVVVVVSAGNYGARTTSSDSANTSAVLGSITEPAHAQDCVAVGIDPSRRAARVRRHVDLGQGPDARRPDEARRRGAGGVDLLSRYRRGPRSSRSGSVAGRPGPGRQCGRTRPVADLCRAIRDVDGRAARVRGDRGVPLRAPGVHRPSRAGEGAAHQHCHGSRPGAVRAGRGFGGSDADAHERLNGLTNV